MIDIFEINVIPDSGYHYYFLPIFSDREINYNGEIGRHLEKYYSIINFRADDSEDNNYESVKEKFIRKIDNKPYFSWKKSSNENYQYFQYKLAKKMIGNVTFYGIHICIDTTTGTSGHGLIKRVIDDVKENKNIKNFETPYFGKDEAANNFTINVLDIFSDLKEDFFSDGNYSIEIRINTLRMQRYLDMTLFVDYGNSRTTASIIDNDILQQVNPDDLKTKVRSIVLSNNLPCAKVDSLENNTFENHETIVDSWFVASKPKLQQDIEVEHKKDDKKENNTSIWNKIKSLFSKNSSDNIIRRYIMKPFLFCETAPIVLGKEAYKLAAASNPENAFMYYFSSPKRYLWDDNRPSNVNIWHMVNINDSGEATISDFDCYYNYFYKKVKNSNSLDNIVKLFDRKIFKERFSDFGMFSNRDLMIFNALKIIETSYIQSNNESLRSEQAGLKRFIKDIIITYPASWTKKELDEYKLVWEQAKAIFYLSHFSEKKLVNFATIADPGSNCNKNKPCEETFFNINIDINESVASSIPIVFSEIKQLNEKVSTWIDLYGKRDNCVRVFSLDIGGGTQDISIIDFSNGSQGQKIRLDYEVILNESSRDAGDLLIKKLLEDVLFPYFLKNVSDREVKDSFVEQLNKVQGNAVSTMQRNTLTRTVYMPIVLDWLQKLNIESKDISSKNLVTSINTTNVILENLKIHNNLFRNSIIKLDRNSKITVSKEEVERVINQWIKDLIREPIVLYEAFECDMLIVSGKPSELREVSQVIKKYFPINNNAIVFLKGYIIFPHNGTLWLPFLHDSKIYDAKLSAIIGSLLIHSACRDDLFKGWEGINEKINKNIKNYYWKFGKDDNNCFIYDPYKSTTPEKTFTFSSANKSISIYRFLFKGSNNIQKIYEFQYIGQNNIDNEYKVTFEIDGEELKYTNLTDSNGKYRKDDFILKVNTLEDQFYWLDNPRYDNIKI